ncbi:MAG: GDP-mannose 4,6-dehydratase [Candidatus Diapherotrites archaeon]|nr:GDP-mannose 4,6-dehydratase [Candidatus Diapherotrites archaeon]
MKNFWEEKKVFITGADGFIGSWVAKELVEKKAKVVALVRDLKPGLGFDLHGLRDRITIVNGDLADLKVLQRALNEYEIDSVFHIAAQAIVGIANKSPLSTFESNIKGTWNILEACRLNDSIQRIVVASSDKAYGAQKQLPYTEESPLLGIYPYDASKACADILARSYFATYGLPVAVTRNANTFGGGDMNFSRIIPDAIKCLIDGKKFAIRSDGTPERDYMYVKDASNAYLALGKALDRKELHGEAFNFGTERPVSVVELFKKISSLMGKPNEQPEILGQARNEIDTQYLSISKAKKLLGWQPKYSLEKGLMETIEWYRKFFKSK